MVDTAGGHNLMNLRTSKWQRASKSMHRKGHLTTTPLLEQCQHVPARSSCLVFCSLLSWAICEKSDNTLDFWFKRVCFQHFAGIRPAKRQRRSVEDWCGAGHGPGLDFWIWKVDAMDGRNSTKAGICRFLKLGEIPSNWTLLYSIQNCSPMSMTTFGAAQWSVCTDFCQEFLEQFSVLKVPDWQQWSLVWWQESVWICDFSLVFSYLPDWNIVL